jgi:choline dehydrogenase
MMTAEQPDCEYVVVGSGAGGGTLAARLAEAGKSVILIEAGGDPRTLIGRNPTGPRESLPDDYDVPAFHPLASENDALKWDFFVRHYGNEQQQRRDPKYREFRDGPGSARVDGVLYPRAGTLGGCTAHNAMILVCPHDADWNGIAELTGDASWNADNMRGYFRRLENCRYRSPWLARLGLDRSEHGWNGWLDAEVAIPAAVLADKPLVRTLAESALTAFREVGDPIEHVRGILKGGIDPNDRRRVPTGGEGVFCLPLTTRDHQRIGARERLLEVAAAHPDRLRIVLNALATRVVFDEHHRAVGVEYLSGGRLYRADARANQASGERRTIRASREVILAGGSFNTPQLLMLSGVGPRAALDRHGIAVRVDLPGVGKNLQDRYEVGVVNRMAADWDVLAGARFRRGDPQYREWSDDREGMYITNGGALVVIKRSLPARPLPDLFCMALLADFRGYFPGYSDLIAKHHDYLTWAVLKAHTVNNAGEVTLRSDNPLDPPDINFKYFEEGSDTEGDDLDSVVAGIRFVRTMTAHIDGLIDKEEMPGEHLTSDDQLKDFVRANAWGHHAACSCAIGARENGGVLTSDFRVHGTQGLRVVDASVFPRIPGFFIVSAVYMIAEKAADVILGQAAQAAST